MGERGGVVTAGEGEEDPRRHGREVESLLKERETQGDMEEKWSHYCRRGRGTPKEMWRRGRDVTAGELQGEGKPRRHGGDWWSHYWRRGRGRPMKMWKTGSELLTARDRENEQLDTKELELENCFLRNSSTG